MLSLVFGNGGVALSLPGTDPSTLRFVFFFQHLTADGLSRAWAILAFLNNFTGNSVGNCMACFACKQAFMLWTTQAIALWSMYV